MSSEAVANTEDARDGRLNSVMKGTISWQNNYIRTTIYADMLCMLAASTLAINVRFLDPAYRPAPYLIITFALPLVWIVVLRLCDGYDVRYTGVGSDEFRKVFNASICSTALVAIISYATKFDLARFYVAITLPTATVLTLGIRYLLRKRLHMQRRAGRAMHRVIAVGPGDSVANLISELEREVHHGLSVIGACLTDTARFTPTLAGVPVLGGIERITESVSLLKADTVTILASPEFSGLRMRELTWELERYGTNVYLAPTLLEIAESRTTIRPIAGLPLLHMEHPKRTGSRIWMKTFFDRLLASAALIVLAPLFIIIAIAIKLEDKESVFFRQIRIGREGKPFELWKFRTMVSDADRKKAWLASFDQGNGALFKIRRDPRITKVGLRLRRYSLDELPQLINVVKGEMSLVGPRPALPEETAKYDGTQMIRRIVVKPGITGLWQVSGRSDLSLADSTRLDVHYVENWSLFLDLQILWKTFNAVFKGHGAY